MPSILSKPSKMGVFAFFFVVWVFFWASKTLRAPIFENGKVKQAVSQAVASSSLGPQERLALAVSQASTGGLLTRYKHSITKRVDEGEENERRKRPRLRKFFKDVAGGFRRKKTTRRPRIVVTNPAQQEPEGEQQAEPDKDVQRDPSQETFPKFHFASEQFQQGGTEFGFGFSRQAGQASEEQPDAGEPPDYQEKVDALWDDHLERGKKLRVESDALHTSKSSDKIRINFEISGYELDLKTLIIPDNYGYLEMLGKELIGKRLAWGFKNTRDLVDRVTGSNGVVSTFCKGFVSAEQGVLAYDWCFTSQDHQPERKLKMYLSDALLESWVAGVDDLVGQEQPGDSDSKKTETLKELQHVIVKGIVNENTLAFTRAIYRKLGYNIKSGQIQRLNRDSEDEKERDAFNVMLGTANLTGIEKLCIDYWNLLGGCHVSQIIIDLVGVGYVIDKKGKTRWIGQNILNIACVLERTARVESPEDGSH